MPFPKRASAAVICFAMLFSFSGRAPAESGYRSPNRGDGEYITFPGDDTLITIAFDPSGQTLIMRSGGGIYFLHGGERVYLGDIDLADPQNGADVIVLDADFDSQPEFLLKFDSSGTNQYYYLVDKAGAPLGEKLFGDQDMEFSNPTFQSATRSITAWDRSGGLASYSLYKFRSGRYFLSEETEPVYEVSRLMLERRIQYLDADKTRTKLRYYGDTDNKPVRLRAISKTPLWGQVADETPINKYLTGGELVTVTDAAVGEGGHMLKVHRPQNKVEGWAPEEAFLVCTMRDVFLAAAPGSADPAPGNLSGAYIPANTELPVFTERKGQDGGSWLKVYFLEGDASGWIRGAETMAVALPVIP